MVEKYRLNLIVAFAILLIDIWLIWGLRIWDSVGHSREEDVFAVPLSPLPFCVLHSAMNF